MKCTCFPFLRRLVESRGTSATKGATDGQERAKRPSWYFQNSIQFRESARWPGTVERLYDSPKLAEHDRVVRIILDGASNLMRVIKATMLL